MEAVLLDNPYVIAQECLFRYAQKGYTQALIVGEQGAGKTTYCILCSFQVYQDWDEVLKYFFFELDPFNKLYHHLRTNRLRIPYMLFDDAGMHLSKYLWVINKKTQLQVHRLNAIFNTIRDFISTVTLTSPDADLIKEIRTKSWIIGQPHPIGKNIREISLYHKTIPDWDIEKKPIPRYIHTDQFPLWLPDDFRKKYQERRYTAIDNFNSYIDKMMEDEDGPSENAPDTLKFGRHKEVVDLKAHMGKDITGHKLGEIVGITQAVVSLILKQHNTYVTEGGSCPICRTMKGKHEGFIIDTTKTKANLAMESL